MLSEDGLIEVLKGNIQDISTKTQIPESTLRNYRSGKSEISSMPFRMLEALSLYASESYDMFDEPNNYYLTSDIFHRVLERVRENYNQYAEIYNAQIYLNLNHQRYLKGEETNFEPRYFFIDKLDELIADRQCDVELLMSVGLVYGVRFIFNLEYVPFKYKGLYDYAGGIITGSDLKKITQARLDEMRKQLVEFDGVINNNQLYISNIKMMVLRDLMVESSNLDELFISIIKRFINSSSQEELLGFINLDSDQQKIYLKVWYEKFIQIENQGFETEFVNLIQNYFEKQNYSSELLRYN
jgi:hypothetical protein